MAYQGFNPKDVLVGRAGRGIYNHPANARLRKIVDETSFGYEAVDNNGRNAIATKIVREVLNSGGKFVHVDDKTEWTEKQAVENVRRRFDQLRANKKNSGKKRSSNENAESQVLKQGQDANDVPPAALNHPFAGDDEDVDPNYVASDLDIHPRQGAEVVELPPLANQDHHRPASVIASVVQDWSPLQDIEGLEDLLDADFLDEFRGEKGRLQQKLSLAADRSEEMAGALADMVDLAASDGTIDELLYSDQMRACFKSLMMSHETTKRSRRKANTSHHQQHAAGAKEGTKSVVSGSKNSNAESLMSFFASALSFKKDTYIDKLDIVSDRVLGKKGEKEYFGTTLSGVPHGLGVMTYTNKKKRVVGLWRKGKLHGLACAIDEDNHQCFGFFFEERLHGKALYKTNESTYLGEYRKHKRHGRGKLVHYTSGTFDGYFHEDRFEGNGVYTAPNGDRMVGDFVNWNLVSGSTYKKVS